MDQFVCIDISAEQRLLDVAGRDLKQRSDVINNPFISSGKRDFAGQFSSERDDLIKFAIVGSLSSIKGVLFAGEAFLKAQLDNSVLYVVGDGPHRSLLEAFAVQHGEKIRLIGQLEQAATRGLYNEIDVLVWGDPTFRTGRTVFEALYSGAAVVMPGVQTDEFFLFKPRSIEACALALRKAALTVDPSRRHQRERGSNLDDYRPVH